MTSLRTINGDCLQCEAADARAGSKFCSDASRQAFRATMPFVLICRHCSADEGDHETPAQAEVAGWSEVEEDPEGFCWNYLGYCPDCRHHEE
jgi:hypothetical protein